MSHIPYICTRVYGTFITKNQYRYVYAYTSEKFESPQHAVPVLNVPVPVYTCVVYTGSIVRAVNAGLQVQYVYTSTGTGTG